MRPKFLVDPNVGRLAKWLRVIGYDTLFIPEADDTELLRVAMDQGRTVITRDGYIMERRVVTKGKVKVVLLRSDDFREQMRQLTESLGLDYQDCFTLCVECNARLEEVSKEVVRDGVPPFVYESHEQFQACPNCGRLYWRGTHWRNMNAEMDRFWGAGGPGPPGTAVSLVRT